VDLATLVPAGGIAGVLALVILYLLNANRQDRIEHRNERQERDRAMAAQREEHRAEMADLRREYGEQIARLESRVDQVEREMEDERQARIAAEATAATERIRAATAEHQLALIRMPPERS
jgi:vacuolar-type H+-ATPase subunit I/STV1